MGLKESGLRGSLRNTSSVLPAFFDVTITNTNSPVQEGDILTVDYSADNTGDAQDMQDIRLEIDSVQEDVDPDVMLAGGASTTGTLEWDTTGEPEAEYTATVLSDDDSDSVIVEIGFALPDSQDRYLAENFDSPWPNEIADRPEMTINGLSTSTFSNGEESVSGDGSSDHGLISGGAANLPENENIGIALTFEDDDAGAGFDNFIGLRDDSAGNRFELRNRGDGELEPIFTAGGNEIRVLSDAGFFDGNVNFVVINKLGNDATDIDIYVNEIDDGDEISTTVESNEDFDHNDYQANFDLAVLSNNDEGSIGSNLDSDIGLLDFKIGGYDEGERQQLKDSRPEMG